MGSGRAVDVCIPTCDRPGALAVTLAGLAAQDVLPSRVLVSDQSAAPPHGRDRRRLDRVTALLAGRGVPVVVERHVPRRGVAENRAALLDRVRAPACLFLDDDVLLEPGVLGRLSDALRALGGGFVGAAVQGLSHVADVRPEEQAVEWWDSPVTPERVRKGDPAWERWRLHNAANLCHLQRRLEREGALAPGGWRAYKVAWVGGCVLFDTAALRAAGGYGFWRALPPGHRGEDVVAQLRVLERSGGAGIVPSGAFHLELPTTVVDRRADAYALVLEREDREQAALSGISRGAPLLHNV